MIKLRIYKNSKYEDVNKDSFIHLLDKSNDLHLEINNLIFSFNYNDITRIRYQENKVSTLWKLVDKTILSEFLLNYFLLIKFNKRYNFYYKNPLPLEDFD